MAQAIQLPKPAAPQAGLVRQALALQVHSSTTGLHFAHNREGQVLWQPFPEIYFLGTSTSGTL